MLYDLRSSYRRPKLEGLKVVYRVRWAPQEERIGTISRVKDMTLFIGCNCLHHGDLASMRGVE